MRGWLPSFSTLDRKRQRGLVRGFRNQNLTVGPLPWGSPLYQRRKERVMWTVGASYCLSSHCLHDLARCHGLSLTSNVHCVDGSLPIQSTTCKHLFSQHFCFFTTLSNDRNPRRLSGLGANRTCRNIGRRGSSPTLERLGLFAAALGLVVGEFSRPCRGARQNPMSNMRLSFASAAAWLVSHKPTLCVIDPVPHAA